MHKSHGPSISGAIFVAVLFSASRCAIFRLGKCNVGNECAKTAQFFGTK
jgi:hypothetical protein